MEFLSSRRCRRAGAAVLAAVLLVGVASAALLVEADPAGEVDDEVDALIRDAHASDILLTRGDISDTPHAIALYEKALAGQPSDSQKLHVLYRLAQLHGSTYAQREPDRQKAILYYRRIIDEFPPNEPLTHKAMNAIAGHCLVMGRPAEAIGWYEKSLEYDANRLKIRLASTARKATLPEKTVLESLPAPLYKHVDYQRPTRQMTERDIEGMNRYQAVSLKCLAAVLWRLDPVLCESRLRDVMAKRPGSHLAGVAGELLEKVSQVESDALRLPDALDVTVSVPASAPSPGDVAPESETRPALPAEPRSASNAAEATDGCNNKRTWLAALVCVFGMVAVSVSVVLMKRIRHRAKGESRKGKPQ